MKAKPNWHGWSEAEAIQFHEEDGEEEGRRSESRKSKVAAEEEEEEEAGASSIHDLQSLQFRVHLCLFAVQASF
jgi:hypothetical protein